MPKPNRRKLLAKAKANRRPRVEAEMAPAIRRQAVMASVGKDAAGNAVEVELRGPTAIRSDWRDPNDTTPNASREPRRIQGFRRADPLVYLRARKAPITNDHIIAGEIYYRDFELSQLGTYPGAPPHEIRGGGGPAERVVKLISGQRNFAKARAMLGTLAADLLAHVLLGKDGNPPMDIKSWADARIINGKPQDPKQAMGMLTLALDQLVEHYGERRIREFTSFS